MLRITLCSIALILFATTASFSQGTIDPVPDTARIYTDAEAWTHIFSNNDLAGFFAFGKAQTRDFPVSTLSNMAKAVGELSEYAGEGNAPPGGLAFNIQSDIEMRLWRVPQRAQVHRSQLNLTTRALLNAYVQGINCMRLEYLANPLPLVLSTEPVNLTLPALNRLLSRPVTLIDVLAHGIWINTEHARTGAHFLAYDPEQDAVEDPIRKASNSWLIGANENPNGASVLLIDPHMGIELSTAFRPYLTQLDTPTYKACGISFPGFPGIVMGYNADFAWSITQNNPDIVDVYRAPATSSTYTFETSQFPIFSQTATIDVYDFATGTTNPHFATLEWATNYDKPIIRHETDGSGQEFIWYAHTPATSADNIWNFFHDLARATSVPNAMATFSDVRLSLYNFLMTDRFGNQGYIWNGRVPIRGEPTPGTTWDEVQDGTKWAYQWANVHPASDLPTEFRSLFSPPSPGPAVPNVWIQCNAPADLVRPRPTIDLDDYPEYMVHQDTTPSTLRQERADELLRNGAPLSRNASEAASLEVHDLWWAEIRPFVTWLMTKIRSHSRADADTRAMYDRLMLWDGNATMNSAEAVYPFLIRAFYADGLKKVKLVGLPVTQPEMMDFPGTAPSIKELEFFPHRFSGMIVAMDYALKRAASVFPHLVNTQLPFVQSPSSPWTPQPWAGLPTNEVVLGEVKYLDITPSFSGLDLAIWPLGGGVESLWTLASFQFEDPSDAYIENVGINGVVGPFFAQPVESGSQTMIQVEFTNPPVATYLQAVGSTEITHKPARYAQADDFQMGIYKVFPCDEAVIATTAQLIDDVEFIADDNADGDGDPNTGN